MLELDPDTMIDAMVWNNMAFEHDMVEDKDLQIRYKKLLARAKQSLKDKHD